MYNESKKELNAGVCPSCEKPGEYVIEGYNHFGFCYDCKKYWLLCVSSDYHDTDGENRKKVHALLKTFEDITEFMPGKPIIEEEPYFGGCPICGRNDGYFNIWGHQYFFCHGHKVFWHAGCNLFSGWKDEDPGIWLTNMKNFSGYRELSEEGNELEGKEPEPENNIKIDKQIIKQLDILGNCPI